MGLSFGEGIYEGTRHRGSFSSSLSFILTSFSCQWDCNLGRMCQGPRQGRADPFDDAQPIQSCDNLCLYLTKIIIRASLQYHSEVILLSF